MNRPMGVPHAIEESETATPVLPGSTTEVSKGALQRTHATLDVLSRALRSLWRWLTKPNAERARALYLDRPTPTHLVARAAARQAKAARKARTQTLRTLGRRPDGGTAA